MILSLLESTGRLGTSIPLDRHGLGHERVRLRGRRVLCFEARHAALVGGPTACSEFRSTRIRIQALVMIVDLLVLVPRSLTLRRSVAARPADPLPVRINTP